MRRLCTTLVLFLAPAVLPAQEKARTHDITVEDYFTIDTLQQMAVSPDGEYVAFTLARWDKAAGDRKTDLWVLKIGDGKDKPKRLTFDRAGYASPQWSADGKTIYVLARRKQEAEKQPPLDGSAQVWGIDVDGKDLKAVTRVPGGIDALDRGPDGLYYLTSTTNKDDEWKDLKAKFPGVEYGHGSRKVSQLWRLDPDTWRAEKVYDKGRFVREFAASPAGRHVAMITAPDDTVVASEGQSYVEVLDTKTGKVTRPDTKPYREKAATPHAWLEHLAWSPDGKKVAFNVIFDGYPAEIAVISATVNESPATVIVPRPEDYHVRGYGTPLQWRSSEVLCFLGERKGLVRLCNVYPSTSDFMDWPTEGVIEQFGLRGREAVCLVGSLTQPPDLYLVNPKEKDKAIRLTTLNPQVATWKLPKVSAFRWKGANGDDVEGVLELPPDYKEGEKLPLIVHLHGGPTSSTRLHFQYSVYGRTLQAAKGYALLSPNYRGSVGYGDKFLTDLVGKENGIEVEDILKGVDALVEKGIADPGRVGVMGWSNGGYLTNCLIAKSKRFKAASSGAGIVDAAMQWGTNDEPAYMAVLKGGLPWEKPDVYRKASVTLDLNKITTPTLIHVGGGDERCPPPHSRMLYRALKEYNKVPTELLVYPNEPHGLRSYANHEAKLRWDLEWFDKYLKKQ